jgi:hypothetical protein
MKTAAAGTRRYPHHETAIGRNPRMGAIAAVLFAVAFFINGSGTSTNSWFSPTSLMLAGLTCLALHLLGVGTGWYSRRR